MTDLGEARWILGMEIIHDKKIGQIELSQERYIENVLIQIEMNHSRSASTPMEEGATRQLLKLDKAEMNIHEYQSQLGSVMYAMLATRPDLAFAVGILSRHSATPGSKHQIALKRYNDT